MLGFVPQGFAQVVVTNPTSPWTVPAGVTSIKVEVWGVAAAVEVAIVHFQPHMVAAEVEVLIMYLF